MNVSVNILVWNDYRYLPDLFASLAAQTYKDITIRVLDNGSTDGTVEYLQEHHPQYLIARNVRNRGFAPGHNQLMRVAMERWRNTEQLAGGQAGAAGLADKAILLTNADLILHERVIENLVSALRSDPKLGAVQPKLYRAFANVTTEDGLEHNVKSDVLDSTGLALNKNWRLEDRGAGLVDKGQYDSATDLIGPCGALAMFRASALADVAYGDEYLDEDFFAYREDCDLALRLRRAGWTTRFVPTATAHHYRGMYGAEKRGLLDRWRDRRKQRPFPAAMSTRNQLFFLLKNLTCGDVLRFGPWIASSEALRCGYGLLAEPETRRALLAAPRLVPKMLKKRAHALTTRREEASVIRAYVRS